MTMAMNAPRRRRRAWTRYALPLLVGGVCLWLLAGRVAQIDSAQLWQAFGDVSARQWFAATLATAISFWALGRYDAVMHRHLRTDVHDREAQLSGMSAIAIAQVLGLGVLTGTLARWKLVPSLGALRAARVTAAVSASFLIAWAVVTGLTCLLLAPWLLPGWLAGLAVLFTLVLPLASIFLPEFRIRRWRLRMPSMRAILAIGFFAMIDTFAAAAALHILLPETIGYAALLPCFLLALGAGLFAGTPGGVGPFELALLALLPQVPESTLLAAVLAFRLVYYALPAVLAAGYGLYRMLKIRAHTQPRSRSYIPRVVPEPLLAQAPRAESGLCRQNGARLLSAEHSAGLVVDTPQSLTLLFDPLTGPLTPLLPKLARAAQSCNRMALVYKCGPREALAARRAGWKTLRVADEALIDSGQFSLEGARCRQLRRKLRQAEKAGITATRCTELPITEMARLDHAWTHLHGLPRGLSTGRFTPPYVAGQRCYLAWKDGQLLAFVTFHQNNTELTLDLMRHGEDLPDGTMHSLVAAALDEAKSEGLRLSLAAMPARDVAEPALLSRLRAEVATRSGGSGLNRFKDCFAPRRQPLYMAAPDTLSLLLGTIDLALAMRRPPPRPEPLSATDPLPTRPNGAYEGARNALAAPD